jgi:hypothetical protein
MKYEIWKYGKYEITFLDMPIFENMIYGSMFILTFWALGVELRAPAKGPQ